MKKETKLSKRPYIFIAVITILVLYVLNILGPRFTLSGILSEPEELNLWYAGKLMGKAAFVMFTLVVCMGLTMTSKLVLKLPFIRVPEVLQAHQFTAAFIAFGFTLLHVLFFMFDKVIQLTFFEAFIPFVAQREWDTVMGINMGLGISIGIVAFYFALLLVTTSILRKKIVPLKTWRALHYLSFVFYILFLAHGFFSGSDSNEPYMKTLYFTSLFLVISLVLLRIFGKKYFLPKITSESGQQ